MIYGIDLPTGRRGFTRDYAMAATIAGILNPVWLSTEEMDALDSGWTPSADLERELKSRIAYIVTPRICTRPFAPRLIGAIPVSKPPARHLLVDPRRAADDTRTAHEAYRQRRHANERRKAERAERQRREQLEKRRNTWRGEAFAAWMSVDRGQA